MDIDFNNPTSDDPEPIDSTSIDDSLLNGVETLDPTDPFVDNLDANVVSGDSGADVGAIQAPDANTPDPFFVDSTLTTSDSADTSDVSFLDASSSNILSTETSTTLSEPVTAAAGPQFTFISDWRIKQADLIENLEAEYSEKENKSVRDAADWLKKFNQDRENIKESNHIRNRQLEKTFFEDLEKSMQADNQWARVMCVVDVNEAQKSNERDISRLKDLLIDLKNNGH